MKTTWGIAAALLLVAATAMDTSARGRGGKHGFHGHGKKSGHKGSLVEKLGLSEDQQAQLQTLKENIRDQGQALGEQYRTDVEAILTDEQLETLEDLKNPLGLTDEQREQIKDLKDQDLTKEEFRTSFEAILTDEQIQTLEERKANRGQHGKRGKHRNSLVEQLDLTEDQQTQIQTLIEALNEQRQALREEYWTDFEAILTAEQLATLEEFKTNRGRHWRGSEEQAETTETAAAGKVSAVEETSWGRVKDSFGP